MRQVPAAGHTDIAQQLAVIFTPVVREAGLVPLSSFSLGIAMTIGCPTEA